MDVQIKPCSEQAQAYVHRCLQAYNAAYMGESRDFSLCVEEEGAVIAGVVAESVGDTVEVAYLFVDPAYRGRALGSALMQALEAEARRCGMKRILLNTYSFQAPGFYRKLGYQQLFAISPCFDRNSQYFFQKEL